MGGGSTPGPTQVQQSASKTAPWKEAQPLLKDLISKYMGLNTDVTGGQSTAAQAIQDSASGIPNFGLNAAGAVNNLFTADTAPQVGMLKDAYGNLQGNLGGTASGAELNPYDTPGFSDAIKTMIQDTTNSVKGAYAGSGRDPSGAGSFAGSLGRGITQGVSPVIASQFNANKASMMDANKTLFGGAGSTAGGITQQQQVPLMDALQGVNAVPGVNQAFVAPGTTQLDAANTGYQQPFGNLAALLNPAMGLGGMGSQSSGTSTTTSSTPVNMMSNIMGGLAGGAGLLSLFSDKRLKENIEEVGELHDGQKIHRFTYKDSPRTHIGLLAQDVEKREPAAVTKIGPVGMLAVNYRRATDRAASMKKAA